MLESLAAEAFTGFSLSLSHRGMGYSFGAIGFKIKKSITQDGSLINSEWTHAFMQDMTMKQAELEKLHVEIVKLLAEQRKLNAEAGKMTRETFWYPVAIGIGMIGTVATVTAVLIKLL